MKTNLINKYYCSSQKIHLDSEDGREATVLGLDEYGYLKVHSIHYSFNL